MTDELLRIGLKAYYSIWSAKVGTTIEKDLRDVIDAYGDPRRVYHNTSHLEDILEDIESQDIGPTAEALAVLAAIFHDAVYVPGAADNEERSSRLVWHVLENKMERCHIAVIADTVLATRDYAVRGAFLLNETTVEGLTTLSLAKADLASLGFEYSDFEKSGNAVLAEYSILPGTPEWARAQRKRLEFLSKILAANPNVIVNLRQASSNIARASTDLLKALDV